MADVRLTATNPADSSVVPVACNERGELKLEEIPDQSFDGNLDGDLTVSGSAEFAGGVSAAMGTVNTMSLDYKGLYLDNRIKKAEETGISWYQQKSVDNFPNGSRLFCHPDEGLKWYISNNSFFNGSESPKFTLGRDGSAVFAGGKAGFTGEGFLWCTTERGDTIRLVGSSNGMAVWEDYTPPTRRDEIKERWAEKNGIRPMPEESSQDEPETPQ